MIQTGRFTEFVWEFVDIYNKEQEEKTLWELWLHRVFDKPFDEFMKSVDKSNRTAPTQEDIKSTIEGSLSILKSFDPLRERGCDNGTVQAAGNDSG